MTWGELFERARERESERTVEAVHGALADRRTDARGDGVRAETDQPPLSTADVEPSPARVVADADVLAADLLVGGDSRAALDGVRAHSWVVLVASEQLLDDAESVIATLSDDQLAADWRDVVEASSERVAQPAGDHPALASALHGGAMHLLTLDEGLQSADAGAAIRARVETSVKAPGAFAGLFDPEKLYPAVVDGDYPGPDRDPRE